MELSTFLAMPTMLQCVIGFTITLATVVSVSSFIMLFRSWKKA